MNNPYRDNGGKLPAGPTEADYQQAWDAIRAAAKPAIEHTLKVWENMRHNRPLMNAIGIYRLPGDKPLLHNGGKPQMTLTKTVNFTFFDYNHNMRVIMFGIEEYNRTKQLQAVILHHRYWHDHLGQPRRNPTMRPLLHKGKAPR